MADQNDAASLNFMDRLSELLIASNGLTLKAILDRNPELLSEAAVAALRLIRDAIQDPEARSNAGFVVEWILKAREVGTNAAYAHMLSEANPCVSSTNPLAGLLTEIKQAQTESNDASKVAALCKDAIRLILYPNQDHLRVELELTLAVSLIELGKSSGNPEFFKESIVVYDAVILAYPRDCMQIKWAQAQTDRAIALANLGEVTGDPDFLFDALHGYDAALKAIPADGSDEQVAKILTNNAAALSRLHSLIGKTDYLFDALSQYEAALGVLSKESTPVEWGWASNGRASAMATIGHASGLKNLIGEAIDLFDSVIDVLKEENDPNLWETIRINRAGALFSLGELIDSRHLIKGAIDGVNSALDSISREIKPSVWAAVQCSRASAHRALWKLDGDTQSLDAALSCWKRALEVQNLDAEPNKRMSTVVQFATTLFESRRYAEFGEVVEPTIDKVITELGVINPLAQVQALHQATGLAEMSAWIALLRGTDAGVSAVEVLEHGRGMLMALDNETDPLDLALAGKHPTSLTTSQIDEVGEIHSRLVKAAELITFPLEEETRSKLRAIVAAEQEFRKTHGLQQTIHRRTFAELLGAIPRGGALVQILITTNGSKALILTGDSVEPAVLDLKLDSNVLRTWFDGTHAKFGGYQDSYFAWRSASLPPVEGDPFPRLGLVEAEKKFEAELLKLLDRLWTHVFEPIDAYLSVAGLDTKAEIVLLPPGRLTLLPLGSAAPYCDDGFEAKTFAERWTVSVAPSIAVLISGNDRRAAWDATGEPLATLAVLDPAPKRDEAGTALSDPLPGAAADEDVLARYVDRNELKVLAGAAATLPEVEAALLNANVAHFACHVFHNPWESIQSGLILADGIRLTGSNLFSSAVLPAMRLANLLACESGLSGVRLAPEEFLGLPASWLQAGAMAVLASHWPVDDRATHLLTRYFYEAWLDDNGKPHRAPAAALTQAAQRLRRISNDGLAATFEPLRRPEGSIVPKVIDLARPRAVPLDPDKAWAELAAGAPAELDEPETAERICAESRARAFTRSSNPVLRISFSKGTGKSVFYPTADQKLIYATPMAYQLAGKSDRRPFSAAHSWAAFSVHGR